MEDNKSLPFLTREMLDFKHSATFSLIVSSQGSNATSITLRGGTKSGIFSFVHTPNSNGSIATSTFNITDVPIFLSVVDANGTHNLGDVHVRVNLAINGEIVQQLAAGYVATSSAISWPNTNLKDPAPNVGELKIVSITSPSVGDDLGITVPSGQIWRIRAISFQLTTSANAANRKVHLIVSKGAGTYNVCTANTVQTANQAILYTAIPTTPGGDDASDNDIMLPLPNDFILPGGSDLATETENKQSGDAFDSITVYTEIYYNGPVVG